MARPAPSYAPITREAFDHAAGIRGTRQRDAAYAWIKAAEETGYRWVSIGHAIHAWWVHQAAQALAPPAKAGRRPGPRRTGAPL